MGQLIEFPPTFILHRKNENHSFLKQKYLDKIIDASKKHEEEAEYTWTGTSQDQSKVVTSYHQNNNHGFFDQNFINSVIGDSVQELFEKYNFYKKLEPIEAKTTNVWWNVYEPGPP